MSKDLFNEYCCKCDLGVSCEFFGGVGDVFWFVIQKYDVSWLYYDFWLVFDGVLKFWVVFKGLFIDLCEKWLVVQVEDYLLDYVDFEGVIFEGYYGVGIVMFWDWGGYCNLFDDKDLFKDMVSVYCDGLLEVWLDGDKLKGGYVFKCFCDGDKFQWLLIKMDDEYVDVCCNFIVMQNCLVKSGCILVCIVCDGKVEYDYE